MTNNNLGIEKYTSAKEGHYFDRKSARKDPAEIARHVIAFANASGGMLVIGIEDDGSVTGFKRDKAFPVESFEQIPVSLCDPSPAVSFERVDVVNVEGQDDMILVMDIKPSDHQVVHHRNDGSVHLRQQDRSVKQDLNQVRALEYDKGQTYYESELEDRSSIEDIDHEVLDRYKEALGTDASDEQVLRSRGFLRNGHLTRAGVLLFSQNPTLFYPWARIRVLKIDGTELETGSRMNIVKEKTFDGPLPKAVDGAKAMISTLLREFQFLGSDGKFEVIPEYPEFAWFEGLVNAVTHRDYSFTGDHIRVLLFDDRLEIFSPGRLPNIVTLENMKYTRFSRNPNIARTLVDFGWVRELNEGVKRIYDEMQSFFLNDPIYKEPNDAAVLLTLENSATSRVLRSHDALRKQLPADVLDSLNENESAAVRYTLSRGHITSRELSQVTGRATKTTGQILRKLADRGVLVWHGTNLNDPRQYYTLPISE